MKSEKLIQWIFYLLVILTLLTPLWVFKDLLFPFVTSKAFYFRILVEVTLPFYLFLLLRYPKYRPSPKNPLTISVVAFLLFNLIAAVVGVNPLRSIWGNFERMGGEFYLVHMGLLYFYVLMVGQMNLRALRLFLQLLVGLGAAVSLDGVMVQLTHNHFLLADPSYPRISGTFGNPIFIASFLVLPMFLAAFFAASEDVPWKKICYWVAALLQAWVIFLSETRGSVVGMGVGILVAAVLYVVLHPVRRVKVWGGSAVLSFAAVVALLFSFHSYLPQSSPLHRVFNLQDHDTEARVLQWQVALRGYRDHPIFGVGPENYYFIANEYYNPQIYQYDPSWFDKPHNYLIEVLVTGGIFSFAAYVSLVVCSLWALWLAYRRDVLVLGEFCVLVCGIIVYQAQNFFVFDTIGASVAFFMFTGFVGYLWHISRTEDAAAEETGLSPTFSYVAFGVSALVIGYTVYLANVTGIEAARNTNYGYAYINVDPHVAEGYFEIVRSSPFDFDPVQFASKYADFANTLASDPPRGTSSQFVAQVLQNATAAEQDAVSRVPNDPTAWDDLSNLYFSSAIFNKTALDPEAATAAQTALNLAPDRPEPQLAMARVYLAQGNVAAATGLCQRVISSTPTDYDAKQLQRFIDSLTR
jgi:O-antigen ligase